MFEEITHYEVLLFNCDNTCKKDTDSRHFCSKWEIWNYKWLSPFYVHAEFLEYVVHGLLLSWLYYQEMNCIRSCKLQHLKRFWSDKFFIMEPWPETSKSQRAINIRLNSLDSIFIIISPSPKLIIYIYFWIAKRRITKNRMLNDYIPHEAHTTSACSEWTRGNLGEVLVSEMCFGDTGCGLGKSSAICVCLSESCLSHDVIRALCYSFGSEHDITILTHFAVRRCNLSVWMHETIVGSSFTCDDGACGNRTLNLQHSSLALYRLS